MESKKVKQFMELAGQVTEKTFVVKGDKERELGAQLLLSETLEYVIKGLGVTPTINGVQITDPNSLSYKAREGAIDKLEMLDGLADVAYTMFWNKHRFGIPLEEGFDLVSDNNLEKFVKLNNWTKGEIQIKEENWDLEQKVSWPEEVVTVAVKKVDNEFFAVGKDKTGKVRKPSTYKSVDLKKLIG